MGAPLCLPQWSQICQTECYPCDRIEALPMCPVGQGAPGEGEVVVQIAAASVSPLDTKIRAGKAAHARQPLPAVLGVEMAGTVVDVGMGVTAFRPGDEVFGMVGGVGGNQGTQARYIVADARLLAVKPVALSMREVVAMPLRPA